MATQAHCHYCFDVLASRLNKTQAHSLSEFEAAVAASSASLTNGTSSSSVATNGATNGVTNGTNGANVNGTTNGASRNGVNGNGNTEKKFPLFVTWKKLSGGHYDLRGCIGTFDSKPLNEGLRDYSLTA